LEGNQGLEGLCQRGRTHPDLFQVTTTKNTKDIKPTSNSKASWKINTGARDDGEITGEKGGAGILPVRGEWGEKVQGTGEGKSVCMTWGAEKPPQ